eukprot:gnl/TRDRNA2_/TRDRNA2_90930_c0_seq1.p1 gnl/TRDRNA2_/TRDRNA2_90930_c0~~gnl/TRDRNA2_/TRDRNA2_90930_c0_seq1.p1  ORF type:complete len:408 (-),score=57.76 gnl/TRDRNA2_/TRDRNA2_90930_c0_seq1:38-1261(-)
MPRNMLAMLFPQHAKLQTHQPVEHPAASSDNRGYPTQPKGGRGTPTQTHGYDGGGQRAGPHWRPSSGDWKVTSDEGEDRIPLKPRVLPPPSPGKQWMQRVQGCMNSEALPDKPVPDGIRVMSKDGRVEVMPQAACQRTTNLRPPGTRTLLLPEDLLQMKSTQCGICFDNVDDAVCWECQEHWYCQSCATQYLEVALTSKTTPKCPECNAEAGPDLGQKLLDGNYFDKFLLASMHRDGKIKECPNEKCNTIVWVARAKASVPSGDLSVRCPECRWNFCSSCGAAWHDFHHGRTCQEVAKIIADRRQQEADREFKELCKDKNWKVCPGCSQVVEKMDEEACDHMRCLVCKTEFCWSCLADRDVIYAHGNHYHRPTCRFYAAYHGPLEFLPQKCKFCKQNGKPCEPPGAL